MAKFKIMTPVPGWSGSVGEGEGATAFVKGAAELDVIDASSAGRLSYFISAGYVIEALDDVAPADAIRSATLTPHDEAEALERENARLSRAADLDKLRAENARLRAGAPTEVEDKAPIGARTTKGGAR
jgi:hypothetical protein